MPEQIKHMLDAISVGAVISTILGILPAATAVLTFIWTLIRLYETKTVQGWLNK